MTWTGVMTDESDLTAGLLENFRKALQLREKYIKWSLQSPWDDPKNLITDHDVYPYAGSGILIL